MYAYTRKRTCTHTHTQSKGKAFNYHLHGHTYPDKLTCLAQAATVNLCSPNLEAQLLLLFPLTLPTHLTSLSCINGNLAIVRKHTPHYTCLT